MKRQADSAKRNLVLNNVIPLQDKSSEPSELTRNSPCTRASHPSPRMGKALVHVTNAFKGLQLQKSHEIFVGHGAIIGVATLKISAPPKVR